MGLIHLDENGNAVMVNVSGKEDTLRTAEACGEIRVSEEVFEAIENGCVKKGDVLAVAQIAGIQGCKRTAELIPLCHPLFLSHASVTFEKKRENLSIIARCVVETTGKTGVEMEALSGVSAALLTVYDMCKSIDKRMVIGDIHLVLKNGGKSGAFRFAED